jgi:catechol 2,3-dioxygenase-like lactoylglutathione lyase family enzyme
MKSRHSQPYFVLAFIALAVSASTSSLGSAAPVARYHHVHLSAPDANAAVDWYVKHLGGEKSKAGIFVTAAYGRVSLLFFQVKAGFPGSVGSSVDHIGFGYPDIHAKMRELREGGVEIVSDVEQEGPIKYAFVKDPWGTLIEVVEDAETSGFHHVHLATTDPQSTLRWYTEAFGGEVSRYAGVIPGIRYGDMWVLAKKVKQEPAPTKGRSIDHLGWAFDDLDAAAVDLKAKGVKFQSEPYAIGTGKIAFIEGPGGVRIELVGPATKR